MLDNKITDLLQGTTRLDHQRNADIREKLNVPNIIYEFQEYQNNMLKYIYTK
jgi:hypothetical protein